MPRRPRSESSDQFPEALGIPANKIHPVSYFSAGKSPLSVSKSLVKCTKPKDLDETLPYLNYLRPELLPKDTTEISFHEINVLFRQHTNHKNPKIFQDPSHEKYVDLMYRFTYLGGDIRQRIEGKWCCPAPFAAVRMRNLDLLQHMETYVRNEATGYQESLDIRYVSVTNPHGDDFIDISRKKITIYHIALRCNNVEILKYLMKTDQNFKAPNGYESYSELYETLSKVPRTIANKDAHDYLTKEYKRRLKNSIK